MKSADIRKEFTNYFSRNGHTKVSSSSLIPENDPTLLFANAGMNQFKDIFTGKQKPSYNRAVTIQKCVRAGGKHNDLENVGFTARHHTFFEMLGNFSFGDYFKEQAIFHAWELLTKNLKIEPTRLFVTTHFTDNEARELWKKLGVPDSRIFNKGDKDNFWEMGEFGPCGPCSEIYYDHGEQYTMKGFKPGPGQDILDDDQRYVEIWNLVFMQYEKRQDGRFNLPKPSIDTGAGLERVASVLQGKYWNYDTDLFMPIIQATEGLTSKSYNTNHATSFRVIADHVRSATMLITDGVIPSNEGRGYVLRRILRRAIRHLNSLGKNEPGLHRLVPTVFKILGEEYPQNLANVTLAEKLIKSEEDKFLSTLQVGLKYFDDAATGTSSGLSGKDIFKLYDTYGFPTDLTEILCKERKLNFDADGFERLMKERKEESRKTWKAAGQVDLEEFYKIKDAVGETKFLGYENLNCQAKLKYAKHIEDDLYMLIFDQSTFYAESGGQVGDIGKLCKAASGEVICEIIDTQKPVDNLFVHFAKILTSDQKFEVGSSYQLKVDKVKRSLTARNHSATHLLQSALIKVLGNHIKQAGSVVSPDRLRFDFTHTQAMTPDETKKVEEIVNQHIGNNYEVCATLMPKQQAVKAGAMALFGEKYGDEVRVLTMGDVSVELCGGTHVKRTGDIGLFTIVSEASLASGVRRIEAMTSTGAYTLLKGRSELLKSIEQMYNTNQESIKERISSSSSELRDLRKQNSELQDQLNQIKFKSLFNSPQKGQTSGPFIVATISEEIDLRKLTDSFFDLHPGGTVAIIKSIGELYPLIIRTKSAGFDSSACIKKLFELFGGRGGGKKDMAQGSIPSNKLGETIKFLNEYLTK
jgi:alanyl-tRNA synthetase